MPEPWDGHQYSPHEVITILDSYGDGKEADQERAALKRKWIETKKVDIGSVTSLNKAIGKVKNGGEIPWTFGKTGRPRLLSIADLEEIASSLGEIRGQTTDHKKFEELVTMRLKEKAKAKSGSAFEDDFCPCKQTIRTMMQILVQTQAQEMLASAPAVKTSTRYTAENSLMSAMALAATVGGTHAILSEDPVELPPNLTEGARLFERLVREANGGAPVSFVKPEYVLSTDDTTTYIF